MTLTWTSNRSRGTHGILAVEDGDKAVLINRMDVARASTRQKVVDEVMAVCPKLDPKLIEDAVLQLANEAVKAKHSPNPTPYRGRVEIPSSPAVLPPPPDRERLTPPKPLEPKGDASQGAPQSSPVLLITVSLEDKRVTPLESTTNQEQGPGQEVHRG